MQELFFNNKNMHLKRLIVNLIYISQDIVDYLKITNR